jgi:hypothetical protein
MDRERGKKERERRESGETRLNEKSAKIVRTAVPQTVAERENAHCSEKDRGKKRGKTSNRLDRSTD